MTFEEAFETENSAKESREKKMSGEYTASSFDEAFSKDAIKENLGVAIPNRWVDLEWKKLAAKIEEVTKNDLYQVNVPKDSEFDFLNWYINLDGKTQKQLLSKIDEKMGTGEGTDFNTAMLDKVNAYRRQYIADNPFSDVDAFDKDAGGWRGPLDNPISNWLGSAYMGLFNSDLKKKVIEPPEGSVPKVGFLETLFSSIPFTGMTAETLRENPELGYSVGKDISKAEAYGAFPASRVGGAIATRLGEGAIAKGTGAVLSNAVVPTAMEVVDAADEERGFSPLNAASGTLINLGAGKALEGFIAGVASKFGVNPSVIFQKLESGRALTENELAAAKEIASKTADVNLAKQISSLQLRGKTVPADVKANAEQFVSLMEELPNAPTIKYGNIAGFETPFANDVTSGVSNEILKTVSPSQQKAVIATLQRTKWDVPTKTELKNIWEAGDKRVDFDIWYKALVDEINAHNKQASMYQLGDLFSEYGVNWATNRFGDSDFAQEHILNPLFRKGNKLKD